MASDSAKNLLLTILSTALTLLVVIGGYELYKSHRYDQWKSEYRERGDWYDTLTVPSDNDILMWEYRPHGETEKMGSGIRTNRHGFRDLERELAQADGVQRIAFTGDSVTLGIGVDLENTYFRLFEHLSQRGPSASEVEALAFGVDGYSAIQVMELITERVVPFEPDMVVYLMCMNDFDLEGASAGKTKYFRKPDSFFLVRLEKLHKSFFEYHDYHFRKNREAVYERLFEVRDALGAQGIEFRVVLVPIFPKEGFSLYPIAHMHEELVKMLTRNDVPVIDLLGSALTQGDRPRAYAQDIWHLNEQGHRLLAQHLVESLLAEPPDSRGQD